MTVSPLRFFSFSSKRKQTQSDSHATNAALKPENLDFASPTSSEGTHRDAFQSNTEAPPGGLYPPTPATVMSSTEAAKVRHVFMYICMHVLN